MAEGDPTDLGEMLERLDEAAQDTDQVSVGDVIEAAGQRSFGALLLLAGLIMVTPVIGDIPGVPTIMGLIVVLVCAQLIFKRKHFWLPGWLLKRSMAPGKVRKALGWMRKPADFVDRWLRPRYCTFVRGASVYVIALVSMAIALLTPAMEIVPFSANAAGLVLMAFGLALIAHDGVLALVAFALAATTFGMVVYFLASGG